MAEYGENMEAKAHGGGVITIDADPAWLGAFPESYFRDQDSRRHEKAGRHAFSWAVYKGEDRAEAGHFDVQENLRHKELIMQQAFSVWGGLVASRLFPDETRSILVKPDVPDDPISLEKSKVVEAVFREKLNDFISDAISGTIYSGIGHGVACMVGAESEWDESAGGEVVRFLRRWIDFGDFVLDRSAPKASMSPLCRRLRYSKGQLMELSERETDENGEVIREAVFDRAAVEELFKVNTEGVEVYGNPVIRAVKDEADGGVSNGDTCGEWFDCFEFVGDVYRYGKLLAEKQIVTSCAGICLRATDDPDKERSWVVFGAEDGQMNDPYPESKGWLVAMKETEINYYGTLMAHSRTTETFGMFAFDPKDAATVQKWGDLVQFGPRKKIPKIYEKFDYKASSDSFQEVRQENTQAILRLIGVSDQALQGAPQPGVSATAAAGYQAMAETRISLDAKHYYPIFEQLLQIHYRLLLDSWDVEVATLDDGKRVVMTREDLGDFQGQMVLTNVGNMVPNPVRLQNWERVKQDIGGAMQAQLVDPLEFHKVNAEFYGLDPATIGRLFKPKEPQAPEYGQAGPPVDQPMGMAGPPVDNVVQMPGMAVGA